MILNWYDIHQRELPWRKTRDPYHILISEIMSQQTQISRVIPKFTLWLQAFPTIIDLANAPTAEVLKLWSGLGYNRRALNLKKTAQIVAANYNGQFPKSEKELLTLPGIGQYTARAVLCFAFDQQVAVVDTNVRKVILTQFQANEKEIPLIAEQLLPIGKAYQWNQALMDYASTVLKKEKIPVPKQSKFIGSHRYYRGQILKQLLAKKIIPLNKLGALIKKDYTHEEKLWLHNLVDELRNEGFLILKDNSVELAN